MGLRLLAAPATLALLASCLSPACAWADRLVLRDLTIISDRRVVSFDEDGAKLDDGRVIAWDEIERGAVSAAMQPAFDQTRAELGDHLYRIRQRLRVEDYGFREHAEAVYPRYVGRQSETAYRVFVATMWSRLAAGQREAALEPYLRALDYSRQPGAKTDLPGPRRLTIDPATGYSPDLAPVWFDQEAAEKSLPDVHKTLGQMQAPLPPATRIYYATLALAAGRDEMGTRVLEGIDEGQPLMADLREAALAQRELAAGDAASAVQRLSARVGGMSKASRPVGLYWLGRAQMASDQPQTRREGALTLLRLPALYGAANADLAAAGLYEAMQLMSEAKDQKAAAALRKELLSNYGQTHHAARVRAALSQGKDS